MKKRKNQKEKKCSLNTSNEHASNEFRKENTRTLQTSNTALKKNGYLSQDTRKRNKV